MYLLTLKNQLIIIFMNKKLIKETIKHLQLIKSKKSILETLYLENACYFGFINLLANGNKEKYDEIVNFLNHQIDTSEEKLIEILLK